MNEEKCFCHFNGYEVKDASARSDIESLKTKTSSLENEVSTNKTSISTMNTDVTKNKTDIEVIKTDIETLKTDTSLNTEYINTNIENISALDTKMGSLPTLQTEDKTSIVDAVNSIKKEVDEADTTLLNEKLNELIEKVGSLESLETTDKTSLVNAINEIKEEDTGWIDLEASRGDFIYFRYRKIGNEVQIRGYGPYQFETVGEVIAVLPESIKPDKYNKHHFTIVGGFRLARVAANMEGNLVMEWITDITTGEYYKESTWIEFDFRYFLGEEINEDNA